MMTHSLRAALRLGQTQTQAAVAAVAAVAVAAAPT